jgi:hypothetical protein
MLHLLGRGKQQTFSGCCVPASSFNRYRQRDFYFISEPARLNQQSPSLDNSVRKHTQINPGKP